MFSIIRRIGTITRTIQMTSNQRFKPLKLNNNLFLYLIRICEKPGMFLGEVADSVQIDRTTSFRTLKKLEKMGYLFLKNDDINHKIKRVFPTQKAWDIYPDLHQYEKEESEKLLSNLNQAEQETLIKLLNKLSL